MRLVVQLPQNGGWTVMKSKNAPGRRLHRLMAWPCCPGNWLHAASDLTAPLIAALQDLRAVPFCDAAPVGWV